MINLHEEEMKQSFLAELCNLYDKYGATHFDDEYGTVEFHLRDEIYILVPHYSAGTITYSPRVDYQALSDLGEELFADEIVSVLDRDDYDRIIRVGRVDYYLECDVTPETGEVRYRVSAIANNHRTGTREKRSKPVDLERLLEYG